MRRFILSGHLSIVLATALLLPTAEENVSAAEGRPASATSLGIVVRTAADKLWVAQVNGFAASSFRAGDQIVAVNGRRVSTEAAFMNRLSKSGSGSAIVISRGGRQQTVSLPGAASAGVQAAAVATGNGGGGFLNPSQMVMTSQGAMHIEAARRLGLPHTPFPGRDH